MPVYTDQIGRRIQLDQNPQRIISLVPSQTELLSHLGLGEEIVGITKFCIHPDEWFRSKTRVGGTKNINEAIIRDLQPDLIIANKEENVKEQVYRLAEEFPVWVSDVNNLSDSIEMILAIGEITQRTGKSKEISSEIENRFKLLRPLSAPLKVCYLIWRDPFMSIGRDTFIHDILLRCGLENVTSGMTRYPTVDINHLKELQPDIIMLSSEPYPFKQKHADELQVLVPEAKILLVDGEMFSWYGSRLIKASLYLSELIDDIR